MAPGREGAKEMSTDTMGSHPTFSYVPTAGDRPETVPTAWWARRPLTGRGLESQLEVTAVNDLFTVFSHK